jgi:hypothetical protein
VYRCVNWINKLQLQKSVLHSSSSITDHVKRLPRLSTDTPCYPEPDHAYSLRLRSRSSRAPSLNPAFLGTILKNLRPSRADKDRRRDGYNTYIHTYFYSLQTPSSIIAYSFLRIREKASQWLKAAYKHTHFFHNLTSSGGYSHTK